MEAKPASARYLYTSGYRVVVSDMVLACRVEGFLILLLFISFSPLAVACVA